MTNTKSSPPVSGISASMAPIVVRGIGDTWSACGEIIAANLTLEICHGCSFVARSRSSRRFDSRKDHQADSGLLFSNYLAAACRQTGVGPAQSIRSRRAADAIEYGAKRDYRKRQ